MNNVVIATRQTSDGQPVTFWSDGAIAVGGDRLHSGPIVARNVPRSILWLIADDVCLYDAAEVRGLVKAARRALDGNKRDSRRVRRGDLLRMMRVYAMPGKAAA